jgi:transposase InsO family protein
MSALGQRRDSFTSSWLCGGSRPRTPRLNGEVERSHRVDDQEFYQLIDQDGISDDIHLFNQKLREWEDYYNYHRPHRALEGQIPFERLMAKTRADVSPRS